MRIILSLILIAFCFSCNFRLPSIDKKFGKQHFISAVSIIELHKTRTGDYPNSLLSLKYLGDWDGIWLSAVQYEKKTTGYNLFVKKGWIGEPALEFPIDFKNGLGIQKTNVKWITN